MSTQPVEPPADDDYVLAEDDPRIPYFDRAIATYRRAQARIAAERGEPPLGS
jgi:hypothetical protein